MREVRGAQGEDPLEDEEDRLEVREDPAEDPVEAREVRRRVEAPMREVREDQEEDPLEDQLEDQEEAEKVLTQEGESNQQWRLFIANLYNILYYDKSCRCKRCCSLFQNDIMEIYIPELEIIDWSIEVRTRDDK